MAKTTKKKEIIVDNGVQLVSDSLETKLVNNLESKKEDEVTLDLGEVKVLEVEQPKVAPVKMVKVLMADNHKCCIGGEWYYLLKDKQYNVPDNVKSVLMKANKLKPL